MGQCNAGQRKENMDTPKPCQELGPKQHCSYSFRHKIGAPIESKSKRQETCGDKKTHVNAVARISTYNRGQQDRKGSPPGAAAKARPCCGISQD